MFDKNEFINQLGRICQFDVDSITDETLLRDDLGASSQQFFALSAVIRKLSDKKVSYADLNQCATVGDIVALVEAR